MKRKRHTPEQIVGHLREAEKLLSEGKTITQVIKKLGVTEQTCFPSDEVGQLGSCWG